MLKAYDDRDGHIWMDGKLIPWRNANVHFNSCFTLWIFSF